MLKVYLIRVHHNHLIVAAKEEARKRPKEAANNHDNQVYESANESGLRVSTIDEDWY